MTDIIEKAARAMADSEAYRMSGVHYPTGPKLFEVRPERFIEDTKAVIRSLRDNTDSPRVCEELTRMLGEEG